MKNLSKTEMKSIQGGIGGQGGCTRIPETVQTPTIEYVNGIPTLVY